LAIDAKLFSALLFADWLGSPPIYEALLRLGLEKREAAKQAGYQS
jgi:hypothetical protein